MGHEKETIEYVLDQALELEKRGVSIQEILKRFPEHRAELDGLLKTTAVLRSEGKRIVPRAEFAERPFGAAPQPEPIRSAIASFRRLVVRTLIAIPAGVAVILFMLIVYSQTKSPVLPIVPTLDELMQEAADLERDSEVSGAAELTKEQRSKFTSEPEPMLQQFTAPAVAPSVEAGLLSAPSAPQAPATVDRNEANTVSVAAFFPNRVLDPNTADCGRVFAVERTVTKTPSIARAAVDELLRGTTLEEATRGYLTSINQGTSINSLTIKDGVAIVDFNEALEFGVGGSCRVTAIRAQIEATLKQFPTVNEVTISINGRTQDILQP